MRNFRKKIELSPRLKFSVGRNYTQNQTLKYVAILCLVFAVGLSLNAARIALHIGQNSSPAAVEPQVLGVSDDTRSNTEKPEFEDYKIQKGDTLFNLSQKFGISWTTIATLNNLKSPFLLKPGQTIKIPR